MGNEETERVRKGEETERILILTFQGGREGWSGGG